MRPPEGARASGGAPAVMLLGRFGAMGLAFLTAPVIARSLGPEGRGFTAAAIAAGAVAPVVIALGLPLAVRRRVAALEGDIGVVVSTARGLALLAAIPCALLAWLLTTVVVGGLGTSESTAFFVAVASAPLTVSWSIDVNVLLALGRYRRVAMLTLTQGLVSLGSILALLALDAVSPPAVVYSFVGGTVATYLLGLASVRNHGRRSRRLCVEILREGVSLAGGLLADALTRRIDQVIALPLLGPAAAGHYSVGSTSGSLASVVSDTFANSAFDRFVGADKALVGRLLRQAIALAGAAGLVVAGASWAFIPWLFGTEFSSSRPVAIVLALAYACAGVALTSSMALSAQQRGREMSRARLVGLAIAIAGFVPAGMAWGPVGAASAMAIGWIVAAALQIWRLGLSPADLVPRGGDFGGAVQFMLKATR